MGSLSSRLALQRPSRAPYSCWPPRRRSRRRSLRRSGRQLLVRRRHRQLHALELARGVYAYPHLVAQQRLNTALAFVACSGATTSSLMANQIQAVTATTSFVSVTIGGNDIGFDIYQYAGRLLIGARLDAGVARDRFQQSARHRLHRDQEPAAGASVVVLGYPRMLERRLLRHARDQLDGAHEGNQARGDLDTAGRARVPAPSVHVQEPLDSFSTHAVCSSSPWLNG